MSSQGGVRAEVFDRGHHAGIYLLTIIALGVRVDQCVSALGLAKKNRGGKGVETNEQWCGPSLLPVSPKIVISLHSDVTGQLEGVVEASHSNPPGSLVPALRAGRQAGVWDSHSDQLLVRGFLPYRPSRGTCEVRGGGPNLWFAVAKALGFTVTSIRCPYLPFVDLVRRFCPGVSVLLAAPQRFDSPPELVLLDADSLPSGPEAHRYWARWLTTHVFYTGGLDADSGLGMGRVQSARLPPGWLEQTVTLSHCSAGGATLGV